MVVDRNHMLNLVNSGMKGYQVFDARSKGRFLGNAQLHILSSFFTHRNSKMFSYYIQWHIPTVNNYEYAINLNIFLLFILFPLTLLFRT